MKKLIAILASVVIACSLAFMVSSCQSNEDKAVSLTEKMIKAAKNDDVKAFVKAAKELAELKDKLSEEEDEAIGKKLDEMFTEEDQAAFMGFAMKHMDELKDLDL